MRSVLIFTTAGNTLATAKTAGSEAGSACARHARDPTRVSASAANRLSAIEKERSSLAVISAASNEAPFALSNNCATYLSCHVSEAKHLWLFSLALREGI